MEKRSLERTTGFARPTAVRIAISISLIAGVTGAALLAGGRASLFEAAGYPGLFFLALISSMTFVIPGPSAVGVVVGGVVLNPWLVGLVMGVGSTIGDSSGYALGVVNRRDLRRMRGSEFLTRFMKKHATLTLFTLAAIPNPLYDVGSVLAAMSFVPFSRFFAASLGGKIFRFTSVAWLSSWSIHLIGVA